MHSMIIEANVQCAKWLCCDGTELSVSEMSDEYLINILAMLDRFSPFAKYCNHSIDEWKLYIKFEQDQRTPKKGIWWLAVDTEECFNLVTEHIPGWHGLESVQHSHVTLAFNVTEEDCPEHVYCNKFEDGKKIGEYTPVNVRGIAYNSKCAALVVDIGSTECCNKHPHITLATAEDVPPVYSNDMLGGKEGAYNFLPLEATLEGTLEFFEFSED